MEVSGHDSGRQAENISHSGMQQNQGKRISDAHGMHCLNQTAVIPCPFSKVAQRRFLNCKGASNPSWLFLPVTEHNWEPTEKQSKQPVCMHPCRSQLPEFLELTASTQSFPYTINEQYIVTERTASRGLELYTVAY